MAGNIFKTIAAIVVVGEASWCDQHYPDKKDVYGGCCTLIEALSERKIMNE